MIGKTFFVLFCLSFVFSLLSGNAVSLTDCILDGAQRSVDYAFSTLGMMVLWCGVMQVLRDCGILQKLTRFTSPLLSRLFPHTWESGNGKEEITAALTANLLGLGNAATPYAIRAMEKLDAENPTPDTATGDMVTLTVLGTASFSLLPTTLLTLRHAAGSTVPAAILPPVWICSAASVLFACILCRTADRIRSGSEKREKRK